MEKSTEICGYSLTETHVAIKGYGYFLVSDTADEDEKELSLSPIGTWEENKQGYFRNHIGQYLNVVYLDDDGLPLIKSPDLNAVLQVASSKSLSYSSKPTTRISFRGRLSPTASLGWPYITNTSVIDSLGIKHALNFYFTCISYGTFQWLFGVAAPESGTDIDSPYDQGMVIEFDNSGLLSLTNGTRSANAPLLNIKWYPSGATSQIIMDFGVIGEGRQLRCLGSTTQLETPEVDGYEAGIYARTTIDEEGCMCAQYTNGEQRIYAQIPILSFSNADKLTINPWKAKA
ncbi:flagellar basal body FlgE domain-containing protein [Candidatus Odyssella thessalonicensis]|uniref:flagellar basal body FlgE domain-containing protein n=1 Tax=Candidatus Odyssella thessalonicensis TaxID=84647 RepID=UPI0015846BCA|nr:flagellar basal body FlgE domain-containing protein [Candidatus Odyssella thessalonicensis]